MCDGVVVPLALHARASRAKDSSAPESEACCEAPASRSRRRSGVSRITRPFGATAPTEKAVSGSVAELSIQKSDLELVAALRSGKSWAAEVLYLRVERVV